MLEHDLSKKIETLTGDRKPLDGQPFCPFPAIDITAMAILFKQALFLTLVGIHLLIPAKPAVTASVLNKPLHILKGIAEKQPDFMRKILTLAELILQLLHQIQRTAILIATLF